MLNSSTGGVVRITSRTYCNHFGLSGFNRGTNIAVVPPIFPSWTANSSRIRPKIWVFPLKCPKFWSNPRWVNNDPSWHFHFYLGCRGALHQGDFRR
jgi:hypothetical protein